MSDHQLEPLTAYEQTIMSQATINIGTIGHVAHGKSTLVRSISGIHTIKFKSEKERNITIKLGYANAKIYKCDTCPRPDCYSSYASDSPFTISCPRDECDGKSKLIRHVSFVDCPGHDVLMATMLNGTAIMDAALLLIAANEPCPQPQTQEHLFAVEIMNIDKFIIVQNKLDLISREQALEQKDQIDTFIKNTKAEGSPIIPAAAQFNVNISAILDFIVNNCKEPDRSNEKNVKMVVIRSFDVNKPGRKTSEFTGGVIGGSLICGELKINDLIEIRPGIISRNGKEVECRPFFTKVTSLYAEENSLNKAQPGGLIGVGTKLDPFYCRADKLVGQVMGKKGELPDIYIEIEVEYFFFQKISGIEKKLDKKNLLSKHENILVNIGSTTSGSTIKKIESERMHLLLVKPACCEIGERVSISKKIQGHWRLIGYGKVTSGVTVEPIYD
ncbi:Translation initiation factor 2, gamma subunit (eIF-2gamma, GTPase) [Pseudoloma neurophilia]|uniref:Eukaryotic translation initiation factor 2 subunit gamma n=1 Tax=Pseudoloma neurophilia TaxID=146866 RepID=A0A0R0M2N0_9MICR|nr:Translation initiation factor 2, gamma subunit (eIF-2gamma, GTPase) [Pseudoloma neurophilia]